MTPQSHARQETHRPSPPDEHPGREGRATAMAIAGPRVVAAWIAAVLIVAIVLALPSMPALAQLGAESGAGAAVQEDPRVTLAAAESRAVEIVLDASQSDSPLMRAHAVEAIQPLPDRALPMAQRLSRDPNPGVRFAAVVTLAELGNPATGPAMRALAAGPRSDPDPNVRAGALVAARQAGEEVNLTPLARLLESGTITQRSNAAMLLGRFGDSSAIPMLQALSSRPVANANPTEQAVFRLQVAEALSRLGDESAKTPVRAATVSGLHEVQVLGIYVVGQIGDEVYQPVLRNRVSDPDRSIEIRVAAATALAELGDQHGADVLIEAAALETININDRQADAAPLRAAAAVGLGLIPQPRAAQRLVSLLDDADPRVRIAAAKAVLMALHQ